MLSCTCVSNFLGGLLISACIGRTLCLLRVNQKHLLLSVLLLLLPAILVYLNLVLLLLYVNIVNVPKEIICDQACENLACRHTKFYHFSKFSLAITLYSTIVWLWKFLQFVHNSSGLVIQVTEGKYSIPITRYNSLSNKV